MSLSIEKFRKMSQSEREKHFEELSPHDKFVVRMEDSNNNTSQLSEEEFLKNPPQGWEMITKEMLDDMFAQVTENTLE